ncbi:Precursor of CEP8 [Camellia lanceoleosa]|uniref:Precursor of CEP8 n=1 Tax=Camellia lanceoleosa TaxID=1840588 RepID=A0ACC0HK01_9ERIC|nr:Precursor of CEP8 [Camellia lanceoleosa]
MGKCGMVCACAFLLVLILCNEVFVGVDGRHLKDRTCKKCMRRGYGKNNMKATMGSGGGNKPSAGKPLTDTANKVEYADDFRPTQPGHSPGIGHSLNN